MKKHLLVLAFLCCGTGVFAQVDSSLLNRNILEIIKEKGPKGNQVRLVQNNLLDSVVQQHIVQNATKKILGFRVRIFISNSQNARSTSQSTLEAFQLVYPSVGVYRGFENPYYKVTVGDFRTKSDAMRFLQEILPQYKSAFIVKEAIAYPL